MKSIAKIIHNKTFPLTLNDSDSKLIYTEYVDGNWYIINQDGTYEFGELKINTSSGITKIDCNVTDYVNML